MPSGKARFSIPGLMAWEPRTFNHSIEMVTPVDNAQILTLELKITLLMVFLPFIFAVQNLNDHYQCCESGTYYSAHGL